LKEGLKKKRENVRPGTVSEATAPATTAFYEEEIVSRLPLSMRVSSSALVSLILSHSLSFPCIPPHTFHPHDIPCLFLEVPANDAVTRVSHRLEKKAEKRHRRRDSTLD
jgi:hypothetical protein